MNKRSTKQIKTKKKKGKLKIGNIVIILMIILLLTSFHLLHNISLFKGIETPLRICVGILLVNIVAIASILALKVKKSKSVKILTTFAIILLIYSGIVMFASKKVEKIYTSISSMQDKQANVNLHSTSLVVKKDSKFKKIDDVKKGKVGVLDEEGNIAASELPKKIIEQEKFDKKNIVTYDNHIELIQDLLDNKIDAAFLPTSYNVMYQSEQFETLGDITRIIYTKEQKDVIEEEDKKVQKSLKDPFTILVMGVDTTGEGIGSSFNGDALLLITFNPKTMNSTILSIPRDSYIPISCMSNRKNKITNAGWQGESCIMKSIENYFGIDIDYYYKINFNGVVSLVDAVGGVDVEVPYSFCEQNSKRQWGKNTIFVEAGLQHLNGEQALAFARHRKVTPYMKSYCGANYTQNAGYWNDFVRGQNQQLILKALLNKLADINSFSSIENLLNTISSNAKTNMSIDTILSLYNLGTSILSNSNSKNQMLNMQRLYLSGYDSYIYDYSFLHNRGTKLTTYNFIIYDQSFKEVVHAMKVNLELEKADVAKTFQYSIHDEYSQTIIGKGSYSKKSLVLMPNLVGLDVSEAKKFATQNGINLVVNEVEGSSSQTVGQIISQDIPKNTDISMLDKNKTVTINVVSKIPINIPITPNNPLKGDKDKDNVEEDDKDTENEDKDKNTAD